MTSFHIPAVRLRTRDVAALAADRTGETLNVWVSDIADEFSTPARPVLRPATMKIVSDDPTFGVDVSTGRVDRSVVVGRRLTAHVVHDDATTEVVHLFTTKTARKSARFGAGAEKVDWIYFDVDPDLHEDGTYTWHRTTGTAGSSFTVSGFVRNLAPHDVEQGVNEALTHYFGDALGLYTTMQVAPASDELVTVGLRDDDGTVSVVETDIVRGEIEPLLEVAGDELVVLPAGAPLYVRP